MATRITGFGPTDGIMSILQIRPSDDVVADGFACLEEDLAGPDRDLYSDAGHRAPVANLLPIASIFIFVTAGLIASDELYTSPRMHEHMGALAPNGQEALFLGSPSLPIAIGSLPGAPVGARIVHDVIAKGATTRPDGLHDLNRAAATGTWLLLMAVGFLSAVSMPLSTRWVGKQEARETRAEA